MHLILQLSFLDRLVWGIINSDPKRIEAKLERTRSTLEYFNSIEEQKIVDFKFGRRAWRIYKSDEKNLNNITPTEGDTINYAGSSYKLVTGFFSIIKRYLLIRIDMIYV